MPNWRQKRHRVAAALPQCAEAKASKPAHEQEADLPAGIRPLRNLMNISAGELARWIKITTPNDRLHIIRVLEMAAGILRDELEESAGHGSLALVDGDTP
jgi:hypothetical protein